MEYVDVTDEEDEDEEEEEEEETGDEERVHQAKQDEDEKKYDDRNTDDSESEDVVRNALGAVSEDDIKVAGTEAHGDKPPVIRYGPLLERQRQIPSSTWHITHPSVPGSSITPPLNHFSKDSKARKASKQFHLAGAFKNVLSIRHEALEESMHLDNGRINAPLLLLGLMY